MGASASLPGTLDKEAVRAAAQAAGEEFDESAFDAAAAEILAARAEILAAEEFLTATAAPAPTAVPAPIDEGGERTVITSALRQAFQKNGSEFMVHTDARFLHGWLYNGPLSKPKVLWASKEKPRKEHAAPDWLTATEFEDAPEVSDAKVKQLAALMRLSKHTVVYSGAGISASAVGQATLSGIKKTGWLEQTRATPTMTHHALAVLGRVGWVHSWVQQSHDGLPQKAGFPQEKVCEVHGSLYDPSNPVVRHSGSLKRSESEWMERGASEADLVLALGTSLSGLHADQVATKAADRALGAPDGVGNPQVGPPALGTAIINLQQTTQDGKMSLKLSGRSDDLLVKLLAELSLTDQLPSKPKRNAVFAQAQSVLVPYDVSGVRLLEGSGQPRMWLDLSPGALVKLISGAKHNHQGAQQPQTVHIGNTNSKGQRVGGKPVPNAGSCPGNGKVEKVDEDSCSLILTIEGAQCRMGTWWLEAAVRGGPRMLPVVNQSPSFEGSPDPSAGGCERAGTLSRKAGKNGAAASGFGATVGGGKKNG